MDLDKKDLKCGFCKQGKEVETECGKLWHDELQKCTAHKKCMQYSALLIQYKMRRFGGFKVNKVMKEIQRGKRLKCAVCMKDKKRRKIAGGATAGCALKRCKKTFHFCCAHKDKEAITRRIEMTKASDVSVSYCVFCGEEHESEYFKTLNCKWVAKDTDSEGDHDDSYSESESDQTDDDDDGTGSSSDSNSRSSSSSSKKTDGDMAKGGQNRKPPPPSQQQQQPSGSGGNNGTADQKSKAGNQTGSTTETNDAASNAAADAASCGGATEGRLETSGYNVVETTHDVLPEAPDNDTDANGNSVVNGNQAHVYGKRLSEEREEVEAKKSRVDGSAQNISKDIVSGTDDNAFVVCFLEKRDQSDRITRSMLEKSVDKLFQVPRDSIFLWHYNARPLNSGHVIYALNEISKALCQKNEDELLRLLFHFHDADISKFDSSVEHNNSLAVNIREELYANIRDQITDNFAKAEQQYKRCVGRLCLVQPLSTYVGFVLLCNETDPMGVARAQVHGEEPVYFWDRSLVLAPGGVGDGQEMPSRSGLQEREFEKLSRYVKGIPVHCVHSWPKDAVLRVADQFSVTGRLHDRYSCHPSSGGAHLVFLGPVDRSIMQYRLYIPKRINRIIDELLTAKHDVFCVLDVGPEVGLCSLDEIVPSLLPEIKMQALTANDPKSAHASCAIIHFSISI